MQSAQRDLDAVTSLVQGSERSDLQLQQAVLFHNGGRLAKAADMYRQVLDDETASVAVKAKTANNQGEIEMMLGDVDAAVDHLELATVLARECNPAIRAGVATTRSWATMQAGRLSESLQLFEEAGQLYLAAGLPLGSHYLQYADALIDLRLLPEADEIVDRAIDELSRSGVQLMVAEGQVRRARLALLRDDPRASIDAAAVAASMFSGQRRQEWAAQTTTVMVDAAGPTRTCHRRLVDEDPTRREPTFERLGLTGRAVESHLSTGVTALALEREPLARHHLGRARGARERLHPLC